MSGLQLQLQLLKTPVLIPLPGMRKRAYLLLQWMKEHYSSLKLQPSSFLRVFDGMDEDGNFRVSEDFDKTRDAGRMVSESISPVKTQEPPQKLDITEEKAQMKKESVVRQEKPHAVPGVPPKPPGIVNRLGKPSTSDSRFAGPSKAAFEQRPCSSRLSGVQPSNTPEDKSNNSEEAKLEVAKRKLHEGYQRIENAKKQRKIQVLELHDLPKPSQNQRPLTRKPRNQSRNWSKA
ncbi:putative mediator of RNA polymerase II transcription subunit 26b [Dendrobium catenatum]|uniref:Putative mediator of RNA polymerase II transcription subunit 26b n=1 Tax=Dendrobium catenatum TaxID=906689 RepID=A0A2I0X3X0_9ASPA|nr:putative mediator of RNA polymerase II transcription subunit 26b [Dendrobium catenatum]